MVAHEPEEQERPLTASSLSDRFHSKPNTPGSPADDY